MRVLLFFLFFVACHLHSEEIPVPQPMNLTPNWSDFLNENIEERTHAILQHIESYAPLFHSPQETQKFNKRSAEIASQLIVLTYLNKNKIEKPASQVWLPKESYTLHEYIQISDIIRSLSAEIHLKKSEINKLKTTAIAFRQTLNNTFVAYSSLPINSLERLLEGLKVLSIGLRMKAYEAELAKVENQLLATKLKNKRYEEERAIINKRLNLEVSYAELQKMRKETREAFRDIQTQIQELEKKSASLNASVVAENSNDHAMRLNQLILAGLQMREKTYHAKLRFLEAQELLSEQIRNHAPIDYAQAIHPLRSFIDSALVQSTDWETQIANEMDYVGKEIIASNEKPTESAFIPYEETLKLSLSNRAYLDELNRQIYHLDLMLTLINRHVAIKESFFQQITYHTKSLLQNLLSTIHEWLDFSLFDIAGTPITLVGILKAAIIILLTFWLSSFTNHGLEQLAKKGKNNREPTIYLLKHIIHYMFILAGILVALASLGLTLQNVAIVLGALGIGIGFGLQSIVNNFLSGLMILFERNIKIGDYIELENGKYGKVMEINIQNTCILTSEGTDILIPNSSLIDTNIINWTKRDPFQRLHIPFSVAYGTDQEVISLAACEAALKVPSTLVNIPGIPNPETWLVKFGESSLEFELIVWVNIFRAAGKCSLKASYLSEIERALKAHKINIPFPQRDIHLRTYNDQPLNTLLSAGSQNEKN